MIGRFEIASLSVLAMTGALGAFLVSGPLVESIPWLGGFRSNLRDSDGVVIEAVNDVRLRSRREISWTDVLGRTSVDYGDQIFVGGSSSAEVDLKEFALSISENSLVRLEKRDDSAIIELEGGGVKLSLAPNLSAEKLRLSMGGRELQVDGAGSEIMLQKNETSKAVGLSFLRGKGAVRAAGGDVVEVEEGKALLVAPTEDGERLELKSLRLEALTPPAEAFAPQDRDLEFSWKMEGKELGELGLEFSADDRFTQIEKRWSLPAAKERKKISISELSPATYHWRLRAKGPEGIWVYSSARKIDLVELRGIKILNPRFRFVKAGTWEVKLALEEIPRTKTYEIQTSRTSDFHEIAHRSVASGFLQDLLFQQEGLFFVRARSLYPGLNEAPWSEAITLEIPAPLSAPAQVSLSRISKTQLRVKWDPVSGADFYRVFEGESEKSAFRKSTDRTPTWTDITAEPMSPRFLKVASYRRDGVYGFPGATHPIPGLVPPLSLTQVILHAPTLARMGRGTSPWLEVSWEGENPGPSVIIEASKFPDFRNAQRVEASVSPARLDVPEFESQYVRVTPKLAAESYLTDPSDVVKVDPQAPPPLRTPATEAPLPNERLYLPGDFRTPIRLSWAKDEKAEGYDVELARDREFKKILLKETVTQAWIMTKSELPSGDFYWRVRAYNQFKESPWGPAQVFRVVYGK